jgi:hypothetical protein
LTVRQPRAEDAVAREKGEEMRFVRKHLETVVVAAVTAFVVAAGPAVATAIVDVARNALHLGGKAPSAFVLKTQLPLKFHNLTLINGWVGSCSGTGPPQIALGRDGMVNLRGGLCGGISNQPFVIPSAYRPQHDKYLVVDETNSGTGRLDIFHTNGAVTLEDDPAVAGSAVSFTSLDGVEYSRFG